MRPISSTSLIFFAQALSYLVPSIRATQWTVRSYAVLSSYVTRPSYDPTFAITDTTTIYLTSVSPTPTASPYSSTVDVLDDLDVTYITYYLPPGAVAQSVIASATRTHSIIDSPFTLFYMPIEYTAPASCPTPFTYTTSTNVFIPSGAESSVTPTAFSTDTLEFSNTYVTAYLTPSAVSLQTPPATTDFIYSDYVASCSNPATTPTYNYGYTYNPTETSSYTGSGGGSYYGGYSFYDDDSNCLGSLCPFWLIYIIIFCTLIPLLFILGIFESYFWFSRLMKGRFAFRGVPLFWVCISLWTLLCLRRSREARPEEQAQLEKEWRGLSTGRRLGLWMRYGFRHKNPPQLDALHANQGPQQQQQQQQPMMYQSAPGQQPFYYQPGSQPYYPPQGHNSSAFPPFPNSQSPMGPQQYPNPNLNPSHQMPITNYPPFGPASGPGMSMHQAYNPPPGQTGATFATSPGGQSPQGQQQYPISTNQTPTSYGPPSSPSDNPIVPVQQIYTPPPGQQAYPPPPPQQLSSEPTQPHFSAPPGNTPQPHSHSSQP
ncbi:MAG: hypothetical protein Q9191_001648 [Dirinaria sp. TL-2023a]